MLSASEEVSSASDKSEERFGGSDGGFGGFEEENSDEVDDTFVED